MSHSRRNAAAHEFVRLAVRARKRETDTAVIRRWSATNAPIAVDEIHSKLALTKRSLVVRRLPNGNEEVVSRHHKTTAAKRAAGQLTAT
jgi:hypothetical protein